MDTRPLPFQKIIFVCTNVRAPGERVCCASGGSVDLHASLKAWVKEQGLRRYIRVCKSGCMDRCEEGPNAMVMPDNTWMCGLDEGRLAALKASLAAEFADYIRPQAPPPAGSAPVGSTE